MRYPARRLVVFVCLAVPLAVSLSLVAQEAAPPAPNQEQPPPPRFRTEANYVRVDAYPVLDGQPVLGLRAEEFEVLEDGVRQDVRAFEHVAISPAGPQTLRGDADSVRGAEQMAANPRNRVFVFFLDVPHVAVEGGHRIKEPLIRLMDRILGPDDLVAVMTPHMSAAQITFGRKTEVVADMLRTEWAWGRRHSIVDLDQREEQYRRCYPPMSVAEGIVPAVVQKMIARRRERMVLDALYDLVGYLGGLREERKAILAITEGWVLFRPDASLTNLRQDPDTGQYERIPGKPPIGVDGWGTLRLDPPNRGVDGQAPSLTECDRERMHLAAIDNEDYFRQLMHVANRQNASFYPIDPRGLAVFDFPMGPNPPPSLEVDRASLSQRREVLRTLAENTDGLAVVNSNDLDAGLRRIADDLTSYYLLGYYSTNTRLDGGYRRITVRVKRHGVEVRARRGYRAATAEEVTAARAAASAPVPDHVRTTAAALASLARLRSDRRFSIMAVPMRDTPSGPVTAVWVVGERRGTIQDIAAGATASIEVAGAATASASAELPPGDRSFVVQVPVQAAVGALDVRARLAGSGSDEPLADAVRIDAGAPAQPLLFRRGPSTGNRVHPAADLRFSRTERLRLELPLPAGGAPGEGRFLDRTGQALPVPITMGERADDGGRRWLTADAQLSPLGAGDYVVEIAYRIDATEHRIQTAVRVTR